MLSRTIITCAVAALRIAAAEAQYYPDYSRGWNEGTCTDKNPAPEGIIQHPTHRGCCEDSYRGQSSGKCLRDCFSRGGCVAADGDVWYPDYSRGYAEGVCISASPVPAGIITFGSNAECCDGSYGSQSSGACVAEMDRISPYTVNAVEVWYPDYASRERDFLDGVCTNAQPIPTGIVTYNTPVECCEGSYAGQSSGTCLALARGTLPVRLVNVWYPNYSLGFNDGVCDNVSPVPEGIITYDTQLECCEASYAGQSSAACLYSLPTKVFESLPGIDAWYPDYSMGWDHGVCINVAPAPDGIITFETQLECCENAYAGQSSDACIWDLPGSARDALPERFFPVFSQNICVSTKEVPRRHGLNMYETELECCNAEYGHGRDPASSGCYAGLPNPPTAVPTPVGGLRLEDVWYPNYSLGWINGICINLAPVPDGIITFETQLECCENSYAGQSSEACIWDLPASARETFPERFFPIFSQNICVSSRAVPRRHGLNMYETQLECCNAEYGHGRDPAYSACYEGLPFPPTTSPTPVGGLRLEDVWYPNYSLGWINGICINLAPVPDGIITYETQLECCENAYAGQSSEVCIWDLPGSARETLPERFFPIFSQNICVSSRAVPRIHGLNMYETQLECCNAEYGHGRDPAFSACYEGLPFPPTQSPTPVGGSSIWYPDYSRGFLGGICRNELPVPNGITTFDSPEACCQNSFAGQSSGACVADINCSIQWQANPDTLTCTLVEVCGEDEGFATELLCCRYSLAIEYGIDPGFCLKSVEFEDISWDVIRITALITNIDLPPTEQGLIELATELESVFVTIVNVLLDSSAIAIDAEIDHNSIHVADPNQRFLLDHRKLQDQPDQPGIFVVGDVFVRRFCLAEEEDCQTKTILDDDFAEEFGNELDERGFGNKDIDVKIQDPDDNPFTPTQAPSPPPTDLSRRSLARQIDLLFAPKHQMSLANDRKKLQMILEDTFSNVQNNVLDDVEDIVLNTYGDSVFPYNSIDDSSASDIEDDADDHEIDIMNFGQCKCVDCKEDKVCGGLWKGRNLTKNASHLALKSTMGQLKIHVVVSHCTESIDWMTNYTKGFDVASIHVISKCGREVVGAPASATIEVQPNVGGCDHSWAYYITTVLPQRVRAGEDEDSVIIFLKDDVNAAAFHQSWHVNDFEGLVQNAASDRGFGCGITPGRVDFGPHSFDLSAYHETKTLHSFSAVVPYNLTMALGSGGDSDDPTFSTGFKSLGLWWKAMGIPPPSEVTQVCYGGVFSASVGNILKTKQSLWKNIERGLSRGNIIQERQYAERTWAMLVSRTVEPYQSDALLEKADGVYMNGQSYLGALLRRPKLYIHIGAEGTSSTEVLTESLVENIETLELDGYRVAVHGKFEAGRYGFPDIDRLGACFWDDMGKSLFPAHMSAAIECPVKLLPTLSKYMSTVVKESHDMIMLNPWLVRPGSAGPLSNYLDPVWDTSIVIYYRRFFEWLKYKFNGWRRDLFENSLSPDITKIPVSSFRYVDFIREYCKQLFYGKDTLEDGFPVRFLNRHEDGPEKSLGESDFDPTSNFDYEELTGLVEYPYFVAKQYHAQSRFRNGIKIVNSHDSHGTETSFYCHVLHDAANACKHATGRERQNQQTNQKPLRANVTLTVDPSLALEDIAVKAYIGGTLSFDPSQPRQKFREQILLWIEMLSQSLQKNSVPIEHLPTECLYMYERRRLLEASLAYERSMLPAFFASHKGGSNLKEEFENHVNFCSVDTEALFSDSNWDFLFESASNFTIQTKRKAFVHIGAARTNDLLVEKALTTNVDHHLLEEDGFMVFAGNGHLAPCMWSDAERQIIAEDMGNDAATCPAHLLTHFNNFLSNATASETDVIIYEEWLSVPSSEIGLVNILSDDFDPVVVLHYRRLFDWILASYHEWRLDIGTETLQSMRGRVRLVDFIRIFCSQLFSSDISHSEQPRLFDLLDFPDYTFNLWKQYTNIPAFREDNIKLVNYHDGHIVKSFYCDVLNSKNACKLASERRVPNHSAKSPTEPLISKYEDMAVGLNWSTGVGHKERFYTLGNNYKDKMDRRGLVEDNLPKECLSEAEKSMLLMVSLEYERIMLPDFHSLGGGEKMRDHFGTLVANGTFCSVDLDKLIDSPEWQFLFEAEDEILAE